ncbi:uncharacterized protein LOC100367189 [Saccoglossus kowalevskii]|uniref:Signal peptide, CUB and EGF-like domain-containing protein 3-like n=1 Tax=Saccoglossus kowalevskii TaxID=10224 RepID=A0ABM0H1E0_SACKO|nr:PREDICTED: signal peptide, CUB and EGF-like domain-containing protein 3-like [Saccoglossus kowalevskii]
MIMGKFGTLVAMVMAICWMSNLINGDDGGNICISTGSRTELVPEVEVKEVRKVDYLPCGECGCDTCIEYSTVFVNRTTYENRTVYYNIEECCKGWAGENCDIPLCNPHCEDGSVCVAPDTCSCPPGYELDDGECEDIDECDTANDGGCEHDCENTDGSYHCECDEGYTLNEDGRSCDFQCNVINSKCIDCSRYQIFTARSETGEITWLEAKETCENLGGVLAMLKTQKINKQVRQYIYSNNLDAEVTKGFWFGLHDRNQEGDFEWMDQTKLADTGFTYWADDNPNNNDKKDVNGQDCVQLWKASSFKWDDDYCSDDANLRKKGYICEFNICGCTCDLRP